MSDHPEFQRPSQWEENISDPDEGQSISEPTQVRDAASVQSRFQAPSPAESMPQYPVPPSQTSPSRIPHPGAGAAKPIAVWMIVAGALGSVLIVVVILAMVVVSMVVRAAARSPQPTHSYSPWTPAPELKAKWRVSAVTLRRDLKKPAFVSEVDGAMDHDYVVASPKTWIVLTAQAPRDQVRIQGLDPTTGEQRWQRDAAQGVCARQLLKGALVCAAATRTDAASGLGTSWKLMRLNPETGAELASSTFDGWLTLMTVQQGRLVLVEQRLPAPHAVITTLNSALERQWRQDLVDQPHHSLLFSENRVTSQGSRIPDGPALDRPRIRQVAHGLMALWSGLATAFVDVKANKLVAMPRCSRLVDDGARLWCNAGDKAQAYSYTMKPLYATPTGVRLAFPDRDPRDGDVTDPVFLKSTGEAVRVDLRSGKVLGLLVPTKNGSAFGTAFSPTVSYAGGVSYIADQSTVYAVKARTGQLLWSSVKLSTVPDAVYRWGDKVLWAGYKLALVDPKDGAIATEYRLRGAYYTQIIDGDLVGLGEEIARLEKP